MGTLSIISWESVYHQGDNSNHFRFIQIRHCVKFKHFRVDFGDSQFLCDLDAKYFINVMQFLDFTKLLSICSDSGDYWLTLFVVMSIVQILFLSKSLKHTGDDINCGGFC